ncbi:dihydrofolate reductase family protein [Amycolatopsis benzoatilytica]|uniref:dihydrofolate reductase family protein n=1 Tax=Amycolatopsis benzoatilytica TaxID=346045 RepID=UPI000374212C|nr:dihydrofolate reductase family protein [Amycolatopsis benzoatilytica]
MGKVLWHVAMSLDGFVAGEGHAMDWMSGVNVAPGVHEAAIARIGAILGGRRGFDAAVAKAPGQVGKQPYGGGWTGPIFVLTHHPDDAPAENGITFLDCGLREAVETGLEAAGGKDLELHSQDIARQCLELGLVDEFAVHLLPVMLGSGVRLFDNPGGQPVRWQRIWDGDPVRAVDLRYAPAR